MKWFYFNRSNIDNSTPHINARENAVVFEEALQRWKMFLPPCLNIHALGSNVLNENGEDRTSSANSRFRAFGVLRYFRASFSVYLVKAPIAEL